MNSEALTEARDSPEILMRETEARKAWGSELMEGNASILPTQLRSLLTGKTRVQLAQSALL